MTVIVGHPDHNGDSLSSPTAAPKNGHPANLTAKRMIVSATDAVVSDGVASNKDHQAKASLFPSDNGTIDQMSTSNGTLGTAHHMTDWVEAIDLFSTETAPLSALPSVRTDTPITERTLEHHQRYRSR